MIKITYKRTLPDFVNFNIFHVWKSPERKFFRLLVFIGIPFIISLILFLTTIAVGIPVTFDNYKGILYAFVVLALLMYLLGGKLITMSIRKKIGKSLSPEVIEYITGDVQLTLTNKEIRMVTAKSELAKPWNEIVKLRITKGYYFIYTDPLQAIVIPWHAFKDNQEKAEFEKQMLTKLTVK